MVGPWILNLQVKEQRVTVYGSGKKETREKAGR